MTAGRHTQRRERAASALPLARLSPLPGQLGTARAEPVAVRARRRRIIAATGISGAGLLAASLSASAGSRQFYLLTTALAGTWAGGALAAGPLPWGRIRDHDNAPHCHVIMPVLTGAGAFGLFYGAARLAQRIPPLNRAITTVMRYPEDGAAPLVILTACANGVAEELFFRGALWSLAEQAHPLATTTFAYAATTAVTRNPALTIAGVTTSVLFGLHRRASGGVLAPAVTHLTWSLLMLSFLPPLFRTPPQPETARLPSRNQADTSLAP